MSLFHAARAMCCDHTEKPLRKNNWACTACTGTHRVSTHALPEQALSQATLHCDLVAGSSRATPRTQLAISRSMTPIMSSVEHLMAIHRYSGLHSDFNRCYMHSKKKLSQDSRTKNEGRRPSTLSQREQKTRNGWSSPFQHDVKRGCKKQACSQMCTQTRNL